MNHDVTRIIDRYLHRYSIVFVQQSWWDEFGRWWDSGEQGFYFKGVVPIAMYRRIYLTGRWSNSGVYHLKGPSNIYYDLEQVGPLPVNY